MGQIMFTSETGMFHSACEVRIGSEVNWYGFQPKTHRMPVGKGRVDMSDRTEFINYSITFRISDSILRGAIKKAVKKYQHRNYGVGFIDCVSFTADVARNCELTVRPSMNILPYDLLLDLARFNTYYSKSL